MLRPTREQPTGLAKHLRIDLVQQWFNLSDPMLEDAFHEIDSMRRFPGLELSEDRIPDETTICKFRDQLEAYDSASIPRV
ncbi:transposase [Salinisphaera hydrothermalis]|uniref:transposase n=1 Tax=Salinisphaera hydrothermalis TaxID=563188 RepID=UPI00333F0708